LKLKIIDDNLTKIFSWKYKGGIKGIIIGIYKALKLIKNEGETLKNIPIYDRPRQISPPVSISNFTQVDILGNWIPGSK